MSTYSFGSGVLFGARTDVPNAPPINFGLIQNVSFDETATVKELYGQYQHPVAIARGSIKTTGKCAVARISGLAMGHLFYGETPTAGQLATSFGEAAIIPAASPYSVASANAANFSADCGVIYAASGLPLVPVSANPSVGQYTLSGGIYVFSAADQGAAILLNYTYNLTTSGEKITIVNRLMGYTPLFSAKFFTTFQGKNISLTLNRCTSSKFSFASKLEDFVMPEFDWSAFADDSGTVGTWSLPEAA